MAPISNSTDVAPPKYHEPVQGTVFHVSWGCPSIPVDYKLTLHLS